MNKQTVLNVMKLRSTQSGIDLLAQVPHNYPEVEQWESLRLEVEAKMTQALGFDVDVLDDGFVMWHYDQADQVEIGWLESDETHWTFQAYDEVELKVHNG